MILMLDTSTSLCRVAVVLDDETHEYSWQADRQLALGLLGYLRDCLANHDASFRDITGIAVMKGPGSFTGLRIGATVANTLARELHIPIVGDTGAEWASKSLKRLHDGQSDTLVLPDYGRPARITTPKK